MQQSNYPMRWRLTDTYSGPEDSRIGDELAAFEQEALTLESALDGLGSPDTHDAWVEVVGVYERMVERIWHVGSYAGCLTSDNVRNDLAQQLMAQVAGHRATVSRLGAEIGRRLAAFDEASFSSLCQVDALQGAAGALQRLRNQGARALSPEMERLARALFRDGHDAWGRMYSATTGSMTFPMHWPDGREEVLPISRVRGLCAHQDPAVRAAAHHGANETWRAHARPLAAALNGISGSRLTLLEARGGADILDEALEDARISRGTLDALLEAVSEGGTLAARYLKARSSLFGEAPLGFHEIAAPLPANAEGAGSLTWDHAVESAIEAFDNAWPPLAAYTRAAFEAHTIEAEERDGKSPGGFCSSSPRSPLSRIFMTFTGSPSDVQTLAHELGHAYHSWVMRDMRVLQRTYPMTLAESASTFAEQIYTQHLLDAPDTPEGLRREVLNTRLSKAVAFLLDIPVRFRFEHALYTRRSRGEVGVGELCQMMEETQREVFGDALPEGGTDPWFWASKMHFYITGVKFYNYPYTFGYLFSMGLWERWRGSAREGRAAYEALLRDTGAATAEEVALRHLGADLGEVDFWRACLRPIEDDLRRFEELR